MDTRIEPMLAAHREIQAYEPKIGDMLADPVVRQVMRRDGVSREDVMRLLDATRAMRKARESANY
jgi:hypothetical protein